MINAQNCYSLVVGIALGFVVSACASTFPYAYYGLDLKDQKLLGPAASDDQPLSVCDATSSNASPCIAMLSDAFLALKKDYKDTQDALVKCQQGSQ